MLHQIKPPYHSIGRTYLPIPSRKWLKPEKITYVQAGDFEAKKTK